MRVVVEVAADRTREEFGPRFDRTLRVTSWIVNDREMLTGPGLVEEVGLRGEGVLGFEEAGPGDPFLKIGVGVLERTDERPYFFSRRYPVLDPGVFRVVDSGSDFVRAEWVSPRMNGYQVRQIKTLRVGPDEIRLDTELENPGERPFSFSHYNHQFLRPTGKRIGPEVSLRTVFPMRPEKPHPFLEIEERTLRVNRRLPDERSAYMRTTDPVPAEQNRVRIRVDGQDWMELEGDFEASHFEFYAMDDAFCPEVFLRRTLAPGERTRWSRTWRIPTMETEE